MQSSSEWKCKDCRSSSSSSATSQDTVITKDFFLSVIGELKKQVCDEQKVSQEKLTTLSTSVNFLSDQFDSMNKLMQQINTEVTTAKNEIIKLKKDNVVLNDEVGTLKDRVRQLEQYTRKNNIEISGVPVTAGENISKILEDVGAAIGVEVHSNDISAAHRIPSFKKDRSQSIIVQFTARVVKETWISNYKELKTPLTAKQINATFTHQRVYISEHLSPENKLFLKALKEKCKQVGFTYAWYREGKFFVRKADGDRCKRINSYDELNALK